MDSSNTGIKIDLTPRDALNYILEHCPFVPEYIRHKSQTDFYVNADVALKLAAYFTTLHTTHIPKPIEVMQLNWMGRIIGPNNYEFWLYLQLAKDLIDCQNNSFINGVPFAIIGSQNYQSEEIKYKALLPTYTVESGYNIRAMTFLNSHNISRYAEQVFWLMHQYFMMDDYGDIFGINQIKMFYLTNESH